MTGDVIHVYPLNDILFGLGFYEFVSGMSPVVSLSSLQGAMLP